MHQFPRCSSLGSCLFPILIHMSHHLCELSVTLSSQPLASHLEQVSFPSHLAQVINVHISPSCTPEPPGLILLNLEDMEEMTAEKADDFPIHGTNLAECVIDKVPHTVINKVGSSTPVGDNAWQAHAHGLGDGIQYRSSLRLLNHAGIAN